MNDRIWIECVDGGFIIETLEHACLPINKRVYVDVEKAADDVRGRMMARCSKKTEESK